MSKHKGLAKEFKIPTMGINHEFFRIRRAQESGELPTSAEVLPGDAHLSPFVGQLFFPHMNSVYLVLYIYVYITCSYLVHHQLQSKLEEIKMSSTY